MNNFLIIVCLFFLYSSTYLSQNKLAVLIANQNYQNISSLKTPFNEIDKLESFFKSNDYQTMVYKDINLFDFNQIIDKIQNNSDFNGTIYFHYAGHGLQIDNENLIVPTSINNDPLDRYELKRKCIKLQDLIDALYNLNNRKSVRSIVCLDACRNNPFKELDHELKPGLSSINRIPNQSAIVFSCTPGNTSADGSGDFSKFAKSWISHLSECGNNFSNIQELVTADMYKSYTLDNQMPHFNVSGLNDFHFCNNIKTSETNEDEQELINFYSGVKAEMMKDFLNKSYHDVILKSQWIQSYLSNDNIEMSEKIEIQHAIANSFFHLDSIEKAEEIYSDLWPYLRNELSYLELTVDVYFYLGRIYTVIQNWSKLNELRRQYVSFCKKSGSPFDLAITYDKIGGDFERQNILDSANIYYSKAIKAGLSCDLNSKKEKRMLSQFYNNRGNFYLMNKTRDIAKARSNLYEALKINKSIELFDFWLIFDLCRLNMEYEGFINLSKAREHLDELKSKSASIQFNISQIFQLKYLEFDLLVKENYITKSLNLLKEVFASYKIDPSISKSQLSTQSFGEDCETEYWEIEISVPENAQPILYIDENENSKLDSSDIVLKPKLDLINSFEAIDLGNDLVSYQVYEKFNPNGSCQIEKCDFKLFNQLVVKKSLMNSYVSYKTINQITTWNFKLYLSDLSIIQKRNFFIGLKSPRYNGEILLGLQDSVLIFPVDKGVEYIKESLRYNYN